MQEQTFLGTMQTAEHHRKKHLVIMGSVFLFLIVLGLWFFLSFVSSKETMTTKPDFSVWQTTRGAAALLFEGISNRFHLFGSSLTVPEKMYTINPTN